MILRRETQGPFDNDIAGRQASFKVDGENDRVDGNGEGPDTRGGRRS